MNVIMKFGGTSVADADAMKRVINIVRHQIARIRAAACQSLSSPRCRRSPIRSWKPDGWPASDRATAAQKVHDLLARHVSVASQARAGHRARHADRAADRRFRRAAADVRRWAEQGGGDAGGHRRDSRRLGELASSRIVAAAFRHRGLNTRLGRLARNLSLDNEHIRRRCRTSKPPPTTTMPSSGRTTAAGEAPVIAIGATHGRRDDDAWARRQ